MIARYEVYVQALTEAREEILHGSPVPAEKVQSESGDSTESKAERLVSLAESFKARAVAAMDEARGLLAVDIENEVIRRRIVSAIWRSCISPRNYPYRSNLCISRRDFYRRRNDFLCEIANSLGIR